MAGFQKILWPTDFSECSQHALAVACEIAARYGAELHLLNVLQDLDAIAPEGGGGFALFEDWLPKLRELAEQKLAELPGPAGAGLKVVRATRPGAPINEVLKYADEIKADLIVIGTHGRTGLLHLLMGSVAENIVRYSPHSVLTVRHPDDPRK